VTVTGPNTGPIPNPTGWSGAKGPVPGVKLPNDFNGVKLATGTSTPAPEQTNTAQKEESEKLAGLYDRNKQAQGGSMNVENLVVKNLTVENGTPSKPSGIVDRFGKPISSGSELGGSTERPQDRATTLLTGIHSTPKTGTGAINYNPADFVEQKPKTSGLVDQYDNPIASGSTATTSSTNDYKKDPRYLQILDETHHELLKEHDSEYYNKNFSGMTPDGKLINKETGVWKGAPIPVTAIDFHAKTNQGEWKAGYKLAEEAATKRFFEKYPNGTKQ
jgi:hypothetical protein